MQVQVRDYRWDKRHLWFIAVPEFTVYEGTEVKPGKWENPEEVLCITTGNPNFPVRSIRRQYIVSIDGNLLTFKCDFTSKKRVQPYELIMKILYGQK